MVNLKRLLLIAESRCSRHTISQNMVVMGWKMQYASDIKQAGRILSCESFEAGVIYLTHEIISLQCNLETLINDHDIKWIAIVDKKILDDKIACQILSQLFFAYHILPIDYRQLDCLLNHAMSMASLSSYSEKMEKLFTGDHEMISATPCMQKLFHAVYRIASVDAPVFISGESGTGKDLAARAIHKHSRRSNGPFVAVNCGALPSGLVQSELFGHEKGAFTDASQQRIGRIEAASGGTLFLDEIGDLPIELQVNLLRFLESYKIRRLSGQEEISVDLRIISATHINLEEAVETGCFREDLYHRLNVLKLHIPPLRERVNDIEILANLFFDKFSDEKPKQLQGFSREAIECMRSYKWPGNVRELINRIRRAMVMCDTNYIMPDDLKLEKHEDLKAIITLEQTRDLAEKRTLQAALIRNKNKILHAANELGVSRVTLYRLIEKHKIDRNEKIYETRNLRESINKGGDTINIKVNYRENDI